MTTLQIIIRKIAVYFSKPIWSFIRNCVFWLFHLNKIKWAKQEMAQLKLWQLEKLMAVFKWKEDTIGDWTPWVATIVYQDFTDDCDGAANLAKWWFKQNGIKADIFNLYSAKEGHTICVTRDRAMMVSNGNVVTLNPATWEADVMQYFNNEYEVMF